MRYTRVSIPRSTLQPLTYSIPENLPRLEAGMRVLVPLASRFVTGFVIEPEVDEEQKEQVKPVSDLLDTQNLFSPQLLKLTRWMADYYMAEWADLMKAALPPGLELRPQTIVRITEKGILDPSTHPILKTLQEKSALPLKKLYELYGHRGTYSQLKALAEEGKLAIQAERIRRRTRDNMVEVVQAPTKPSGPAENTLYEFLRSQDGPLSLETVREKFPRATTLLRKMSQKGMVRTFWLPASPQVAWPDFNRVGQMNAAQQQACEKIRNKLESFGVFLLHGVTGSGKTEVYLRTAGEVLSSGKSVLFLVPEIALLPLLIRRAETTIGIPVTVFHSDLAERERLHAWHQVREGKARLIAGTRSALFAPLKDLGLIVIDEEHDGAFKQGEYPRYHARESAVMRAHFEGCPIILGSATPSMESYFNSGNGKYEYLSLPQRVGERPLPQIRMIDMTSEYRETGDPVFSRFLLSQIESALQRKEQILILQNRRGYASWLMCRACGNIVECPHCSVTLTYHRAPPRLICHYCDYSRLVPSRCEKCNSQYLHLYGVGTQKIVDLLKERLPSARIEQFDRDSTRKPGSIVKILTRFGAGEIDILVGTQMLAKGHDFPGITLVGVVGADSSIGMHDFRATERLFQLITQVSGRSGRGADPGLVVLQTFYPEHYAIQSAITQNYQQFYEREIRFRRLMQFPPYVSLANVIFSGRESKKVLEEAREFAKFVLAFKTQSMKMIGPAIAPVARISRQYRFHLLLKSPSRKDLRNCLRTASEHYRKVPKRHSQLTIDVDPYSLS